MIINKKKVATLDLETDPFLYNRKPEPFCAGFYNGEDYIEIWGDDCIHELHRQLSQIKEKHLIYAHNGGKFDFFYLLHEGYLENPIKIINGRIVKAHFAGHEIRDSYAIMPIPLAAYQKDDIDYKWFEREHRQKYKTQILKYLYKDCVYLHDLTCKFLERFGAKLTIGGTAIKQLMNMHPFENTHQAHDERIRPFYYGGRVQAIETGVLKGKFKVYDVNSMYPFVMANTLHAFGEDNYQSVYTDKSARFVLNEKGFIKGNKTAPYFIHFTGNNNGALPTREKQGLNFNVEYGEFFATSHEVQVALKYNLITIDEIHELHFFDSGILFDDFVNKFINEKINAKKTKDKAGELFAKLIANSSYGKTAQNPENFFDYMIRYETDEYPDLDEWDLHMNISADMEIWKRPAPRPMYYDVAIGASITGAARAVLLEALVNAKRPVYCDTDSIICEELTGVTLDPYILGAWDLEGTGDKLAIAGKKLYALFNKNKGVKMASKGAKLGHNDVLHLAQGREVLWQSDAPNFKLDGSTKFTKRTLKRL